MSTSPTPSEFEQVVRHTVRERAIAGFPNVEADVQEILAAHEAALAKRDREAFLRGRVFEAKVCEREKRHAEADKAKAVAEARIDELTKFELPFRGDHRNCPGYSVGHCIGYMSAQNDFDNEKEKRLAALATKQEGKK